MHPILARRGRLGAYLAAWLPLGGILAILAHFAAGSPWLEAVVLTVPLAVLFAFICLASAYPCRVVPVDRTPLPKLLATHAVAAALSAFLWLFLAITWAVMLEQLPRFSGASQRFPRLVVVFVATGALLYAMAAAVHYLVMASEESRERERRELELRMTAREAELKALRAQVDPHFLFNAMNAIAALTGSDPAGARTMCLDLAGFLRESLRVGTRSTITLAEEVALAERYLAIERARFGSRLEVDVGVEAACAECPVPPLILQPLVENAVTHGISELVEGGTVRIHAERNGQRLLIMVSNPVEPLARERAGEGLGIANVRARLAASYGGEAHLDIQREGHAFRVAVELPATQSAVD